MMNYGYGPWSNLQGTAEHEGTCKLLRTPPLLPLNTQNCTVESMERRKGGGGGGGGGRGVIQH